MVVGGCRDVSFEAHALERGGVSWESIGHSHRCIKVSCNGGVDGHGVLSIGGTRSSGTAGSPKSPGIVVASEGLRANARDGMPISIADASSAHASGTIPRSSGIVVASEG